MAYSEKETKKEIDRMKPLFICYSRCSTCAKAAKWLAERNIEVSVRDIVTNRPSREELEEWLSRSGLPIRNLFNTSGLRYKELNLKARIPVSSEEELLNLLASDGKLVKRPVLVWDGGVLFGFREETWREALCPKR